jgi:hypothetical protein
VGRRWCDAQRDFATAIREEFERARSALTHWSAITSDLDGELAEARRQKRQIDDAILETHSGRALDLSRKAERVPLFAALDRLSVEWGPVRERRRDAALEAKLLLRDVGYLRRKLERLEGKRAQAQG